MEKFWLIKVIPCTDFFKKITNFLEIYDFSEFKQKTAKLPCELNLNHQAKSPNSHHFLGFTERFSWNHQGTFGAHFWTIFRKIANTEKTLWTSSIHQDFSWIHQSTPGDFLGFTECFSWIHRAIFLDSPSDFAPVIPRKSPGDLKNVFEITTEKKSKKW